jgi:hypothetical protein
MDGAGRAHEKQPRNIVCRSLSPRSRSSRRWKRFASPISFFLEFEAEISLANQPISGTRYLEVTVHVSSSRTPAHCSPSP